MKKSLYIILALCLLSLVMNFVDGVIAPPYFIKSLIKAVLFLGAPAIYFYKNSEEREELERIFTFKKQPLLIALGLGAAAYAAIVGGYLLLKDYIDFSGIAENLIKNGITPQNFVFIAVYIALCNSFLEEFFFRVFGFAVLKNKVGQKTACALSAGCFAFYHVGMTLGWVEFYLFALGFLGLALGGLFFNYLCEKTKSIYPSWVLHMFINFGINTIGFILFEMI